MLLQLYSMSYKHLTLDSFPVGVKSIYYMGKRLTREEFVEITRKSNLIKNTKIIS